MQMCYWQNTLIVSDKKKFKKKLLDLFIVFSLTLKNKQGQEQELREH